MKNRPHTRYEQQLFRNGYNVIVGTDEVGRGAWAGPIVAAAVALPARPRTYRVRDSKLLTPHQRETLAARIKATALHWAVGVVSSEDIDIIGIGPANHEAIRRAVSALHAVVDHILIDGRMTVTGLPAPYTTIVDGDALVYSIAAASIVAKVERDHLMTQLHEQYPEYGFHEHKGYGTPTHLDALQHHGLCAIHRRSFHPMCTMV